MSSPITSTTTQPTGSPTAEAPPEPSASSAASAADLSATGRPLAANDPDEVPPLIRATLVRIMADFHIRLLELGVACRITQRPNPYRIVLLVDHPRTVHVEILMGPGAADDVPAAHDPAGEGHQADTK